VPQPIEIRPMREEDVPAVHATGMAAFEDLDRRLGAYPGPPPAASEAHARFLHLLATDPGGAWVADRDGEVVGSAVAILREGIWGLSFLVVDPGAQSGGTGRALLARAWEYGQGARGWIVLSSKDPRAIRAYARLGLDVHPCLSATGRPRAAAMPDGVRPGTLADLPLTAEVDRAVRGAPHGDDLRVPIGTGADFLVLPGRGYAFVRQGAVKLLAATDEEAARDLLRAAIASAGDGEANVEWISAAQRWAVGVCLEAGLELQPTTGPVFTGGEVGPFRPYLPSGAYL
jgi:GNAT superfamily N-acetyltransferase